MESRPAMRLAEASTSDATMRPAILFLTEDPWRRVRLKRRRVNGTSRIFYDASCFVTCARSSRACAAWREPLMEYSECALQRGVVTVRTDPTKGEGFAGPSVVTGRAVIACGRESESSCERLNHR